MSAFNSFEISATGLTAERLRMDVASNNIANVETTRTPEGGPYRREMVVFEPRGGDQAPFRLPAAIQRLMGDDDGADGSVSSDDSGAYDGVGAAQGFSPAGQGSFGQDIGQGVRVVAVVNDGSPGRLVYEPGHPDANAQGYVEMPNVSMINEMVDMMSATRAYEANISAIDSAKSMAQQAISIVGQSTAF